MPRPIRPTIAHTQPQGPAGAGDPSGQGRDSAVELTTGRDQIRSLDPRTHQAIREQLAAAVDFEVIAGRGTLDDHLAGCPGCRRLVAGLVRDQDRLVALAADDVRLLKPVPARLADLRTRRVAKFGGAVPTLLVAALAVVLVAATVHLGPFGPSRPAVGASSSGLSSAPASGPAASSTASGTSSMVVSWTAITATVVTRSTSLGQVVTMADGRFATVGSLCKAPADPTSCGSALWLSKDGRAWAAAGGTGLQGGLGISALAVTKDSLLATSSATAPTGGVAVVLAWVDGSGWTTLAKFATSGGTTRVVAGGPGFVAVGTTGSADGQQLAVTISADGRAWKAVGTPMPLASGSSAGKQKVALLSLISTAGGSVVAGGSRCAAGGCRVILASTRDGADWSLADTTGDAFQGELNGLAEGSGGLVGVGSGPPVGSSSVGSSAAPDASVRQEASTDPGSGSGTEARAWFSPDGLAWQPATIGGQPAASMDAVAWIGNRYLALGRDDLGVVAAWTSPDGRSWDRVAAPKTTGTFTSVAGTGSTIVATGMDANGGPILWVGRVQP